MAWPLLLRARMKHGMVAAVICSLIGTAQAGPREALGHIRDAIDLVDEEGGKCKRDVLEDLEDIKDLLKDDASDRAAKRIRSLRKDADRCPERVDKLLGKASRALEPDDDREGRGRGRDRGRDRRDEPAAPARIAGVPYADWHADCRDHWLIIEIARHNTAEKTLNDMKAMFGSACDNPNGMSAANYPNGTMAKSSSGDWYYPNGTMAKSSSGAYYYPNGTMAKSASGGWYYPNGTMALGSSAWYYKNGTMAGGFDALVSQACSRSKAACATYKLAQNSTVDDWRVFAVVQLETRAK